MKAMKLSLVTVVVPVLLAGTSMATVAQSDETDISPVVVSGTLECLDSSASEDGDGIGQSVVTVHAWQASDERLSGEVTYTGQWQLYEQPSEDAGSVETSGDSAVYEIVNEGGGWLCETARAAAPRSGQDTHTLVFSGADDYEGLTAYLNVDWNTVPFSFSGLILPGEAPPYAEPAQ